VSKPHVSGNAGFELRPWKRFRIVESWMTNRFHDAGFANLTEYALLSATATGAPTLSTLPDRLVVNYNQNQTDLFLDVTSKITLRGGYRYVWGDATTRSSPLDPNGFFESGKLNRQVAIAGFNVRPIEKFTVNADYEGSSTTHVYFRTSLYNFHRFRARARYQATNSLSFQANFTLLDNQNPVTAVSYDFRSRNNSFSVNWIPGGGKRFAIVAEYDRSTVRSDINYLEPRDLPKLEVVVVRSPQGQRHDRHVVDRARLHKRRGHAGRQPIEVRGDLLVQANERPLLVFANEEADDDHRLAGARGGVEVLDARHFPQQLLERRGHTLLYLACRRAGHLDEDVDHRHDDLRLFLARQFPHRETAQKQAARNEQRSQLRGDPRLRELSSRTQPSAHCRTSTRAPSDIDAGAERITFSPGFKPESTSRLPPRRSPTVIRRVCATPFSATITETSCPRSVTAVTGTATTWWLPRGKTARPNMPERK
jgi:hypothetical protein